MVLHHSKFLARYSAVRAPDTSPSQTIQAHPGDTPVFLAIQPGFSFPRLQTGPFVSTLWVEGKANNGQGEQLYGSSCQ
jgi:hypothetical protein